MEILLRRVPKIVNWRTSYNKSAVRLAIHQGHHEIVKCLLAKGVACPGEKCLLLREALGFCDYSMTGNQDETVLELISSFAMDGSGTSLKSVKFLTRNTITLPLTHLQSHIIPSEYKADVW